MWLNVLMCVLCAYLLGNLNGSVCISALMHDDVRSHGSGNAGLTNFIRNYGTGRALLVILIDAGKAVVACLTGGLLLAPFGFWLEGVMLAGLAVLLGHSFPALLGFRGGKGILSGLFVALVADWRIALILIAVFAIVYFTTRYVSLGTICATILFVAISFIPAFGNTVYFSLFAGLIALIIVFKHRENIKRLLSGTENRLSF
jgi:glycerol-3-phosphate acyltransferase PlsY